MKRFKTLLFVKSSLISLYIALTIPIPFVAIDKLKIFSVITFLLGLFLIINITDDYVETCDNKILFKTTFISRILGKKSWEIFWKDISLIKSFPTSQGSKVFYFNTNKGDTYLIPQRLENFEKFLSVISEKTQLDVSHISYISPLWTYKLLTWISVFMVMGELIAFLY